MVKVEIIFKFLYLNLLRKNTYQYFFKVKYKMLYSLSVYYYNYLLIFTKKLLEM